MQSRLVIIEYAGYILWQLFLRRLGFMGMKYCITLDANVWEEIILKTKVKPPPLFGHTAVFHGPVMWIYGGSYSREIKNELWSLDIGRKHMYMSVIII